MSLYNGPARGGNRGGKDQFNWDSVKNDKDRDYYLGHSVKAATGRWQKGKDILWYTRQKGSDEAQQRQDELAAIKEREEELMAEAMGLKPKSRPVAKPKLDATEMEALMRKARGEDDEPAQPAGENADHMPGLGFQAGDDTLTGGGGNAHEVLAGTGVRPGGPGASGAAAGGALPPPPRLTPDQQAQLAAAEKRAAKATRKAEKEAKSLAKAVRKEEKKAAKRKRQEGQEANGRSGKEGEANGRSGREGEHSKSQRHRSASPEARHNKKHYRHENRH